MIRCDFLLRILLMNVAYSLGSPSVNQQIPNNVMESWLAPSYPPSPLFSGNVADMNSAPMPDYLGGDAGQPAGYPVDLENLFTGAGENMAASELPGDYIADGVESKMEMDYIRSQTQSFWYPTSFGGAGVPGMNADQSQSFLPYPSTSAEYAGSGPASSFYDVAAGQAVGNYPSYQPVVSYADQHNVSVGGTTYVPRDTLIPNKETYGGIPNKAAAVEPIYPDLSYLTSPPPVELPAESCVTESGEAGQCTTAEDCGYTNGVVNGLCHQGMDDVDHLRVCCVYPSYCGYETNKEVTYFKNPDYPNFSYDTELCLYRVNLLPGVCQLRVDFVEFSLKDKSSSGACKQENLMSMSSPTRGAFVPAKTFCGQLEDVLDQVRTDMSHVYVHFDEMPAEGGYSAVPTKTDPYVDFKVKVTNHKSKWNLRISQIFCEDAPLQAPSGCSQYYTERNATISSMDIVDMTEEDLVMTACIKTDPTACAMRYKIQSLLLGDGKKRKSGKTQLGYGLTCRDYLAFNGLKSGICGIAENKEIILPMHGPQGFTYVNERGSKAEGSGFEMTYSYLHHCDDTTNYFQYPVPK